MVCTSSSSSSSSCASFGSFDDVVSARPPPANCVKFICSYGGKIFPRYPDGKLRYFGGETRVLAVDRSVSFPALQAKMGELCGWGAAVVVKCQLPAEDLDALVSVTSTEDLLNLIEEYDLARKSAAASAPIKIKAFLHHQSPASPPPSSSSRVGREIRSAAPTPSRISSRSAACYHGSGNSHHHRHHHRYLVNTGNHWQ